jgi:hypothetical protein
VKQLDTVIVSLASQNDLDALKLKNPKDGMQRHENFLQETEVGREHLDNFYKAIATAKDVLEHKVANVLERKFGFNAMFHGRIPEQMVKPGGQPSQGYRSQFTNMISSQDVIASKELKKMKLQRENSLLNRRVNITNHCLTHKCSTYCLVEKVKRVPYDHNLNANRINVETYQDSSTGCTFEKVRSSECRMHFGRALKIDYSGEKNITGGMPFAKDPFIWIDKNQVPKFGGRRNHPRIVMEPHASLFFGANNDIQPILINASHDKTMAALGYNDDEHDLYLRNLLMLNLAGMDHYHGSHAIDEYITSYQCKGGSSSRELQQKMDKLTSIFCAEEGNQHKNIRSLIGTHMHDIAKGMSVTRDQSQYMLSGGVLKRSYGTIRKCSVSSVSLDDIGVEDNGRKTFTWKNVIYHYRHRNPGLENVSLYFFCCCHWPYDAKVKPVQFYGFHNKPKWPLEEQYSKWILTIYFPWCDSVDELAQPTFAEFLTKNYTSPHISSRVRAAISRAKYNLGDVDVTESTIDITRGQHHSTPTDNRVDERLIDYADTNDAFESSAIETQDYLDENQFHNLRPAPDDYNWTESHVDTVIYEDQHMQEWLINEKEVFYSTRTTMTADTTEVELFDEDKFRPENARGRKQKMIIFMLLYQHFVYEQWKELVNADGSAVQQQDKPSPPPCIFLLVEGKPGSGKSFVLNTLRNISRAITKSNHGELTSAPTGVAGSLINASTHCRVASIPTGRDFSKPPTNITSTKCQKLQSLSNSHRHIFTRLLDEHSMMGRKYFGWMKHRMEELRKPEYDKVLHNIEDVPTSNDLPASIYSRPFGGIPFLMTCGDFAQLPAVMDKLMFDDAPAKANTSDLCGKLAFSEFLNSPNTTVAISCSIIMDEVIRQDDPIFKGFLHRLGDGSMNLDDVELIRSRCLENLSMEEQQAFCNAIHIVPTWEKAAEISYSYLTMTSTPIAKWTCQYSSIRRDGKNCCFKEKSYPTRVAISIGSPVMLLKNFIVEEWKILNGSVGTLIDVIYDDPSGPTVPGKLPLYCVVDFPASNVPENHKCIPGMPPSIVSIPLITEHCERRCCSMSTIPLRLCVAITTYKSQGMTCGYGELFEKVVVHLPLSRTRRAITGQELVQFSRAKELTCIAVGNSADDLTTEQLLKIGKTSGNEKRKCFLDKLLNMEQATLMTFEQNIAMLDNRYNDCERKTFDGGCDFLLHWYRSNYF